MVLNGKFSVKVVMSLLIVSLLTTSFGGAFATAAWAATPDEETQSVESGGKADNAVVGGILALGLLAAITGGKKSSSSSDPAKSAQSQPAQTTPTTTAKTPTTTTSQSTTKPSTSVSSSTKPATSTPSSYSGLTSVEQQAFNLMNADRAVNGLPALKLNTKLTVLARDYGQDMINRNFFSHYNPEGQSPFDRMSQYGISYRYAGENLAINRSVDAAEQAFMNSPGHRANILNANYTEVGIGVRYDGSQVYVVQEFIKP